MKGHKLKSAQGLRLKEAYDRVVLKNGLLGYYLVNGCSRQVNTGRYPPFPGGARVIGAIAMQFPTTRIQV